MVHECSVPHSQKTATCLYPEPDTPSPCRRHTCWRSVLILSSIYAQVFQVVSCLQVSLTKTLYEPLLAPVHATCLASVILLYLITRTMFGEQYRSLNSSLCSLLHFPVISSLLGSNGLPSTLFWSTLSLFSSLNVSDQVSHPYKTTDKIMIGYWPTNCTVICF